MRFACYRYFFKSSAASRLHYLFPTFSLPITFVLLYVINPLRGLLFNYIDNIAGSLAMFISILFVALVFEFIYFRVVVKLSTFKLLVLMLKANTAFTIMLVITMVIYFSFSFYLYDVLVHPASEAQYITPY